jgi:molecular chaperone GrpE
MEMEMEKGMEMSESVKGEAKAEAEPEASAKLEEYLERIKHLQADFENYKKRVARERAEWEQLVEDRTILKFLPIYDELERAFRSFNRNNDQESFIEGVEQIFAHFRAILEKEGVAPLVALGQPFDPAYHEALFTVESDGEPNIILEEFERGYTRWGRLLRPSRVKVSKPRTTANLKEGQHG